MKAGAAALLTLVLIASCRAPAAEGESAASPPVYALLPLRNLTSELDAPVLLTSRMRQLLVERGARVVPGDELERILQARRIRYVDTISRNDASAIAAETGATHLLLGTLIDYNTAYPPHISLALRVLETGEGRRVQSALVSLSGEDFTGLLGLGTIEDVDRLAWEVAVRAADMFDPSGRPVPPRVDTRQLAYSAPSSWYVQMLHTDPELRLEPGTRVAILPLENRSLYPAAGQVFVDILGHAWLHGLGIEALETSELLEALRRARVTSMSGLDPSVLLEAVRPVGVRYLVLGTVDHFEPEATSEEGLTPELEVWLRLLDVETDRVVAGIGLRRRGDDYERVLGLGEEIDAIRLAERMARELLATLSG